MEAVKALESALEEATEKINARFEAQETQVELLHKELHDIKLELHDLKLELCDNCKKLQLQDEEINKLCLQTAQLKEEIAVLKASMTEVCILPPIQYH